MLKEILINTTTSETRIAILENKTLVEMFIERPETERMVGDIYYGKVSKVLPGMMAAFIDIGHTQNAFLHFSDINPNYFDYSGVTDTNKRKHHKLNFKDKNIQMKENEDILVQVSKEPLSTKGARVTTEVAIPGRFLVLIPGEKYIGISKRIENFKERKRLKKLARDMLPENCGLIVRTVAQDKDDATVKKDLENLLKIWKTIEKKIKKEEAPALVYKDMGMASSVIRDIFTVDIERVVIDDKKLLRNINTYLKDSAPKLLDKVEYYKRQKPLFEEFAIENDMRKILDPKAWLAGGGHIIINHTEAMVTVDVNSGKFIGRQNYELNATKVNVEAAKEIARQLRLRDIGGLIVIDFIDIVEEKNKKKVYFESTLR